MLLDPAALDKIIQQTISKGHQFVEIFAERKYTNSLSMENNKLEKIRNGIDAGTGLRIINGDQTFYGFANSLDETEVSNLAQEVSAFAKRSTKGKYNHLGQAVGRSAPLAKRHPETVSMQERIAAISLANQAARDFDKRIAQATVSFADSAQEILIANSEGLLATDHRIRSRLAVQAIAQKGGMIQTGFEGPGTTQGFEMFETFNPDSIGHEASRRAIHNLEAEPAPSGTMPVVLAGEAGGTMVHEACGHALEADFIYKGISVFNNSLGKKRVSPLVSVIDDGTISGMYGTTTIDDEGTPCQKNILIDKGYVRRFMNDRINAHALGLKLSGNGRRESYKYIPMPRMTNTYIAAGKSSYSEIISSLKQGLLVKKMGGGQVDITNGNFVFEVTEGYLVKNGRIVTPIRGATLVGNGIDVLASVDMVGDDLHFIPGICGKGQSAPVSDGQPTLRIPKLIIGGQ